jgi:Domain of unknown function (DUF5753)
VITRARPVQFAGLIGAAALRQLIGSRAIMVEQLRYLLEMATDPMWTCESFRTTADGIRPWKGRSS